MLESGFDVLAAFLIARNMRHWWAWAPAALSAGMLIAIVFALGAAAVDLMSGTEALQRATDDIITRAVFCLLCTWGLSGKRFTA